MRDCVFCKILAGEIPSCRIYEDDRATAFEKYLKTSSGRAFAKKRL